MKLLQDIHLEQRRQAREYEDYLRHKVEAGRASMNNNRGRPNDEVEATFAARRNQAATAKT